MEIIHVKGWHLLERKKATCKYLVHADESTLILTNSWPGLCNASLLTCDTANTHGKKKIRSWAHVGEREKNTPSTLRNVWNTVLLLATPEFSGTGVTQDGHINRCITCSCTPTNEQVVKHLMISVCSWSPTLIYSSSLVSEKRTLAFNFQCKSIAERKEDFCLESKMKRK